MDDLFIDSPLLDGAREHHSLTTFPLAGNYLPKTMDGLATIVNRRFFLEPLLYGAHTNKGQPRLPRSLIIAYPAVLDRRKSFIVYLPTDQLTKFQCPFSVEYSA
jgi:hypothetical protein